MAISSQLRQRIQDVVGEWRRELYGEQGYPEWGTKFTEMENVACEIGDAVTCALLQQALQGQADEPVTEDGGRCQVCQQPTRPHPDGPEPQVVTSKRGDVAWQAPHRLCDRCRQAFFPSASSVGRAT